MTTLRERTALMDSAALAFAEHHSQWRTEIDPELLQAISVLWFAEERDTPARAWKDARAAHPAIYKFLRIDPSESVARYAIEPFRVHTDPDTGKSRILVAWPCPRLIDEQDDHLVIEQVLCWYPTAGRVEVMRDPSPQLFGMIRDTEAGTLFADPFAFFRAWVEARAAWAGEYLASIGQAWRAKPIERDHVPGFLIAGEPEAIDWSQYNLPQSLNCVGIDPRQVNRAILKAARLPFATSDNLRRAA